MRVATYARAAPRYTLAAYTRKAYGAVLLFIELPLFGRHLQLTDDELRAVQREIVDNPLCGDLPAAQLKRLVEVDVLSEELSDG